MATLSCYLFIKFGNCMTLVLFFFFEMADPFLTSGSKPVELVEPITET